MWTLLITIIWLITKDHVLVMSHPVVEEFSLDSMIRHVRAIDSINPVDNDDLIENWQDWILANLISVNYLNSLMVLASRDDFAFTIPFFYRVKYVQDTQSFRQTISQLGTEMLNTLTDARTSLNRVHAGMQGVPQKLKNMAVLVKQEKFELLVKLLNGSFNQTEKLVNESLDVLQKPKKNFEHVLNLLTEIDSLLNVTTADQMIVLQVNDLKTQWTLLTELINKLAKRAKTTRENLVLQYNWVLQQVMRSGSPFPDVLRDFIISLLLPKIVEIDRSSDVLGMITRTYSDISLQFTDEQISGNANLVLIPEERERQRYLNRFRHDLSPQAVQIARLALAQHKKFLQRDKNRQTEYDILVASSSKANLKKKN